MNAIGTIFVLINAALILALPRKWAPLPVLLGTCYMTMGQGFDLGPFTLTVVRILVLVSFVRIMARGEGLAGGVSPVDKVMALWCVVGMLSGLFYDDVFGALVFRSGLIFNTAGPYFLFRVFCTSYQDILGLLKITALLLIPLALEMLQEQASAKNLFSVLGGVPETVGYRNGRLRAQGPFRHAILAGTVGAACFPLMLAIFRSHKKTAIAGMAACLTMVLACASSGPIMSLGFALFALVLWKFRVHLRKIQWAAVGMLVVLEIITEKPVYHLISRIDLTGGSTGWHRYALIDASIRYFGEWWLAGTDYTRHWMATGVSWSENHSDMTNHYIALGVQGGVFFMGIYVLYLIKAFRGVGRLVKDEADKDERRKFVAWCLGASLFSHACSSISVNYFDQSVVFIYLAIAAIVSLEQTRLVERETSSNTETAESEDQSETPPFTPPRPAFPWGGRLQ